MKLLMLLTFTTVFSNIYSQVNLNTGGIEYSIPLYNYESARNRLSADLRLVYTGSNGIKVDEIASDVGLGWRISGGGVITRHQYGEPDDQVASNISFVPFAPVFANSTTIRKVYGNGYLYSSTDPTIPVSKSIAYIPGSDAPSIFKPDMSILDDKQQDVFTFDFGGASGSFIICKDGTIRSLYDSKFKIEMEDEDMTSQNVRTRIKAFSITNQFGIKYIFRDFTLDEVCYYKATKYANYNNLGQFNGLYDIASAIGILAAGSPTISYSEAIPLGSYVINKWYLSEILNTASGESITFDYDDINLDYISSKNISYTPVAFDNGVIADIQNPKIVITSSRVLEKAKRLKKVNLPNNEKWIFEFSNQPRIDLDNSYKLNTITKNIDGRQINQFIFNCGYFYKKTIKEYQDQFDGLDKRFARLCLLSVQQAGENKDITLPPYQFEYFMGNNPEVISTPEKDYDYVPPRLTIFSDWYGYYNFGGAAGTGPSAPIPGDPANYLGYYAPLITTVLEFVKNDLHRRNPHRIAFKNGLLKSITSPAGGKITYDIKYNETSVTDGQGTVIGSGGGIVYKVTTFDGLDHSKDIVQKYSFVKEDGTSSYWGGESPVNKYQDKVDLISPTASMIPSLSAKEFAFKGINLATSYVNGFHKVWGEYKVVMEWDLTPEPSQAKLEFATSIVNQFLVQIITGLVQYFVAQQEIPSNCIRYSNVPYNFANLLPSQFSRVEVENQNSSSNGKSVYEFTSDLDYPVTNTNNNFPFKSQARCFNPCYGLLKKTSYYDKNNNIIKQKENTYKVTSELLNQNKYASQSVSIFRYISKPYSENEMIPFETFIHESDISREVYYPFAGRVELEKTIEKTNPGTLSEFTITTENKYNENNFLLKETKTTTSEKKIIEVKNYYPEDFNQAVLPVINSMITKNMLNYPITTEVWETNLQGNKYLKNSSVSEFGLTPNGDIKTVKVHAFINKKPVLEGTEIADFDPTKIVRDETLIKPIAQTVYDQTGNSVQNHDLLGNRSSCSIYGYSNRYPIALVSNAALSEVLYSSFEQGETNGWKIEKGEIKKGKSPTGNMFVNEDVTEHKFIVKPNLPFIPQRHSKITLWATGNTINVDALLPSITGPTIDSWTYYEFDIPANYNGALEIVGTGKIDELRLYPSNARLGTVTYSLSGGKTSECDQNNRIAYYEYDRLGRLQIIRNEKGDIVKAYQYGFNN